ncbi:hypothetical protein ES703_07262 [subsurface metagenome]
MALIVQKYGGSSVADAEKIKNVAGRIARARDEGDEVVVVVSAMGDTTDELIELAYQISENPDNRELDVLLSTGEVVSSTLLAMSLHVMGYPAISLSGAQAGIRTDSAYSRARILQIEPKRVVRELGKGSASVNLPAPGTGEGEYRHCGRLSGHDRGHGCHHAGTGWLGYHCRGAGGHSGGGSVPDLHRC